MVNLLWPVFLLAGIETVAITPGITKFAPLAPGSDVKVGFRPWNSLGGTLLAGSIDTAR